MTNLTTKEAFVSGSIKGKLNKEDREKWKILDINAQKELIALYKRDKTMFNNRFKELTSQININDNNDFSKMGLNNFSDNTKMIANYLKQHQMYGHGNKWLNTILNSGRNSPEIYMVSFLIDIVDQNYAMLHEIDQQKQNQEKIINQNEQIIELLTKIADK